MSWHNLCCVVLHLTYVVCMIYGMVICVVYVMLVHVCFMSLYLCPLYFVVSNCMSITLLGI